MSIPSLYFDRIIRWLPEISRRESVKFWRAKKNSFLLGGFRIQDNEFKNSKSSVCKRVLQLCNKQSDAAIVWLAGLARSTPNSPIGEFYFPDYAKDPSALTLAQVDSLSAVPPFTMCVFSAQVLNEALKRIRELPAENKSQEANKAIFEELDTDFNRIVEAVPALREFLAGDEGTAEEASDEKSEKAEKSVKEENAATAAPETSSTIEEEPPSIPEASEVAQNETEAPIAPEQDDAANASAKEVPSPTQEAADAQSTEIRPASEAVDKRPPVVEEPIPRQFTLGIPFLSITEPAPGNRRVLGCVRQIGSFFNFYPAAVFEDGAWMPITMAEARERFPKFGGINLFSQQRRTFLTTTPYLLDWGETELIKTAESNPDYGIRLNADQVFHDGLIRPASDLGGFVVVYPENGRMPGPNESDLVRVSFSPKPLNEKPDASGRPINVAELLGFLNPRSSSLPTTAFTAHTGSQKTRPAIGTSRSAQTAPTAFSKATNCRPKSLCCASPDTAAYPRPTGARSRTTSSLQRAWKPQSSTVWSLCSFSTSSAASCLPRGRSAKRSNGGFSSASNARSSSLTMTVSAMRVLSASCACCAGMTAAKNA